MKTTSLKPLLMVAAIALLAIVAQAQTGGGLYNPSSSDTAAYFPTDLRNVVLYNNYTSSSDNAKWTLRTDEPGLENQLYIRHTPGTTSPNNQSLWLAPSDSLIIRAPSLYYPDGERDIGATGVRPRDLNLAGTVKTGAPSGATNETWKLGSVVTETCTLDTTVDLRVEVNGVMKRIAICQ
jgi:hypothetical protein